MSRSKKSRKPGSAPTAKPKLSKKELEQVEKRIKKSTGKKAGNRQQEAKPKATQAMTLPKKDPRIGSKKLIVLGKENPPQNLVKPNKIKPTPIATVQTIDTTAEQQLSVDHLALTVELEALEQDLTLQKILLKQEQEAELSSAEIDYFNEKMQRHQEIYTALGWDDNEEEQDSKNTSSQLSEDDLWDKLDNNDLFKF